MTDSTTAVPATEPVADAPVETVPAVSEGRPRRRTRRQISEKPQTGRSNASKKKTKKKKSTKKKISRFEGFCWWCTNPKPTLKCSSTCGRYFHPNCLEGYLRGDLKPGVLDESTGEIGKSVVNWNDSDDESRNRRRPPPSTREREERNLKMFGGDAVDGKEREESSDTTTSSQTQSSAAPTPMTTVVEQMDVDLGAEADREDNGQSVELMEAQQSRQSLSSHEDNEEKSIVPPEPGTAPGYPDGVDPKAFLQELVGGWVSTNYHAHTFFECLQCRANCHQCFICSSAEGDAPTESCSVDDCGYHYHEECLKDEKWASLWYRNAKGALICPRHRCCSSLCEQNPPLPNQGGPARKGRKRAKKGKARKNAPPQRRCWYCPRAYHRNCVPPKVELPGMGLNMTPDDNVKTPDYVFDLIICRDHSASQDGLFGRNDAACGVLTLDFSAFGIHEDVIVGLPSKNYFDPLEHLRAKFEESRAPINAACPVVVDPFGHRYTKLSQNQWVQPAKKPKLTKSKQAEYSMCGCTSESPCTYNNCLNAMINVECFNMNCNVGDLCRNRNFTMSSPDTAPIVVKQTPDKGRGTFASRDLQENELVVEYVGEVLTTEVGDKRLAQMNANEAENFYFMSMTSKYVIDALNKGGVGRFLNHSCHPNCRCDLWDVQGVPRLGIFAKVPIKEGTELTYDYQYEVKEPDPYGRGLQRCMCGAPNCRIFLGFSRKLANEFRKNFPTLIPPDNYVYEEVVPNVVASVEGAEEMDLDEEKDENDENVKPESDSQEEDHASDVEMTDATQEKGHVDSDIVAPIMVFGSGSD